MKVSQFDNQTRMVSVENLRAMCERISGTCHTFTVEYTKQHSVKVTYSNPDEYGNPEPVSALLPAFNAYDGALGVVLHPIRYYGCYGKNEYAYQAFDQLWDCPKLWRNPQTGIWESDYEIVVRRNPELKVTSTWDQHGCIQTWHCQGQQFKSFDAASTFAVEQSKQGTLPHAETLNP